MAAWWLEQARAQDEQTSVMRLEEADEANLDAALRGALRATRRHANAGASGAAELLVAFRHELGGVDVSGLRCMPLDGDIGRRLPVELLGDPRISAARLPTRKASGGVGLAGALLHHAKAIVEELVSAHSPAVFKIGITCSPLVRWRHYERDGYCQFHMLHATPEPGAVQMLEAALIDAFQGRQGCRNIARGGEGPVGRPPYFAYLALAPCGAGIGLLVAAKHAQQPQVQQQRRKRPRGARDEADLFED